MWKRGEIAPNEQFLLFSTIFSVYLYFKDSNYIFICEMWLFDLSFFLSSANLICRDTDISNYFREFLGLRYNESRLYIENFNNRKKENFQIKKNLIFSSFLLKTWIVSTR